MYAAQLLQHLFIPTATLESDQPSHFVNLEDHIKGWRKQKENTGCDSSGLTFSHYIAACEDKELAKFDADIRSLPYQYGFSPTNWLNITDVEILKKAGVHGIEKMKAEYTFCGPLSQQSHLFFQCDRRRMMQSRTRCCL